MTREEAIETIKRNCTEDSQLREACAMFIPELAESEDERIRKWLYDYISNCPNNNFAFYGGVGKDAVLNYLEKQKDILGERAQNITANMLEDGIEGIQRELIEFLSNTVNASWVYIIRSADAYAERIRNIIEKQKGSELLNNDEYHTVKVEILDRLYAHEKELEQLKKEQKLSKQLSGTFTSYDMAKTFTEGQNYVIAHPEKFGLCKPAECGEDERIRKELIGYAELKLKYFTEANSKNDIDKKNQKWWKDVIAYLEKQKEQKPAVLSDDFELALEQFLMNADSSSNTFAEDVKKYANRLREIAKKEQKPAEWSEEDEKMFELLHTCVCRCINDDRLDYAKREQISKRIIPFIEQLKSLRPQLHWKPSEYTLSLVKKVADGEMLTGMEQMAMKTLCDDLKKL